MRTGEEPVVGDHTETIIVRLHPRLSDEDRTVLRGVAEVPGGEKQVFRSTDELVIVLQYLLQRPGKGAGSISSSFIREQ